MLKLDSVSVGHVLIVAAATTFAATSQAQTTSRSQIGAAFQITYGLVEQVDVSKLEARTSAASGAAMGGAAGLIAASHDDDLRGAAEGAALGALITGLMARHQRKNAPDVFTYTVALNQGGESRMISDHGDIRVGDCVSLEFGQTNNIRRVSETYCDTAHQDALYHDEVHAAAQAEADECHNAKQQVLASNTEEELDLAMKKARLFCES